MARYRISQRFIPVSAWSILFAVTGAPAPVSKALAAEDPQNKIAFTRSGDVWVKDLVTGLERQLTTHPKDDAHPAWSPLKDRIVFSSKRDVNYEIYVMNSDGTGQRRLTNHPATDNGP